MRRLLVVALAGVLLSMAPEAGTARAALAPIHHVFVIVLENESSSTTFGPASPAPYLSKTLRAQGAYLPHYYGIGHQSNDNYVAMISGQAPTPQNQADCPLFDNITPGTIGAYGQAQGAGCVYPSAVQTVANQLSGAGLTWRDYNESMGADPTREASECGHPGVGSADGTQKATKTDEYATRHDPFVYFHSIIDDTTLCDTHVVNLDYLPHDLVTAADTPNYVFITPDLCSDGHDSPCASGQPGGLAQADSFLRTWVPKITGSPAFKQQGGLLIITFDEAATSDTSACCQEIPGPNSPRPGISGPGGGDVGAVLLSPCIAAGTVSDTPYNHYTMLRSVEDIFGLGHLGYAGLGGETSFGPDVFTRPCGRSSPGRPHAPVTHLYAPALASRQATRPRIRIRWRTNAAHPHFTVQVRRLGSGSQRWRTLLRLTSRRSLRFRARLGRTYQFRVRASDAASGTGSWASAIAVVPTGVHVPGGHYRGRWRLRRVRGAWEGRAIATSSRGASFTLSYVGGTITIIGDRSPRGGRALVILDGRGRTISLRSRRPRVRQVLYRAALRSGAHNLTIRVLGGLVALEGLGIEDRLR